MAQDKKPHIPFLPSPPNKLAQAPVKQMTIDPSKVTPEVYLLAKVEAIDVRLQHLEENTSEIRKGIEEIKAAHGAMGWKVVGALASAIGALLAAGYHLVLHQLKGQ